MVDILQSAAIILVALAVIVNTKHTRTLVRFLLDKERRS